MIYYLSVHWHSIVAKITVGRVPRSYVTFRCLKNFALLPIAARSGTELNVWFDKSTGVGSAYKSLESLRFLIITRARTLEICTQSIIVREQLGPNGPT